MADRPVPDWPTVPWDPSGHAGHADYVGEQGPGVSAMKEDGPSHQSPAKGRGRQGAGGSTHASPTKGGGVKPSPGKGGGMKPSPAKGGGAGGGGGCRRFWGRGGARRSDHSRRGASRGRAGAIQVSSAA